MLSKGGLPLAPPGAAGGNAARAGGGELVDCAEPGLLSSGNGLVEGLPRTMAALAEDLLVLALVEACSRPARSTWAALTGASAMMVCASETPTTQDLHPPEQSSMEGLNSVRWSKSNCIRCVVRCILLFGAVTCLIALVGCKKVVHMILQQLRHHADVSFRQAMRMNKGLCQL